MKGFFLVVCFLLFFPSSFCLASGGITHMYIAQQALLQLPNPLRNLLLENMDAYLVGSYYPDSGYVKGCVYGEISHWDPFVYAFLDHIKEKYPNPSKQNPKLVAFLFGVATHRVSDEVSHSIFYPIMRDKDFHGDSEKAHRYGDEGIDLLINVDKNLWQSFPSTWWVPVDDLLAIYKRMGHYEITKEHIRMGNSVIYFAGYGERLIAAPAYPVLQLKMPWTAWHYSSWPTGGIKANIKNVATYQTALWERLQSKTATKPPTLASKPEYLSHDLVTNQPIFNFAQSVITDGLVTMGVTLNHDGSFNIQPPVINNAGKFKTLIKELLNKVTS